MLTLTPLVPDKNSDVTVHIVLNDFGHLGRAYIETDEAEADEATIVENILSGQYSRPLRVVAFNTAEDWARDVTEDIACAVLNRASRVPNRTSRAGVLREGARCGRASGRLTYSTFGNCGHRALHGSFML